MCIATIALASAAIGATTAVVGGIEQGQAAHYQAEVARNNAQTAQQNAVYSASAGAAQTEQAGLKAASKQATLRAGLAANNVDVNTGSAADIQTSERQIGQLDTETVSNNAALQAYGYQTQSTSDQAQAKLDDKEGDYAPIAGVLKGAGMLAANPTVDSAVSSSLLSGPPSVPEGFQWMKGDDYDPTIGSP